MRFGSFRYLVKQGWRNMGANRLMTFASVGVLTACLLITGIAGLLSINVTRAVDYLSEQNEIILYIQPEATEEEIAALAQQIEQVPNLLNVTYVSQDEAFQELLGMLEEYKELLEGYPNPLPASFRVTVDDLAFIEQTDFQLKALPNVEKTVSPSEVAGIIVKIRNAVTYGGFALVVLLALVSIIVISNTIRLTVFARRREISIMKYVGATNAFIRLPFFVEGMTVGAISGLLAGGIVSGAYYFAADYIRQSSTLWVRNITSRILPLNEIWYILILVFVASAMLLGSIGTATSVRKHLKV